MPMVTLPHVVLLSKEVIKSSQPPDASTASARGHLSVWDWYMSVGGFGSCLCYEQTLDISALRCALGAALTDYPWLAGRLQRVQDGALDIVCDNSGAELAISTSSISCAKLAARLGATGQQGQRAQLANPWAAHMPPIGVDHVVRQRTPLLKVFVCQLQGGGSLMWVVVYHMVTDFTGLQNFGACLAAHYDTALAAAAAATTGSSGSVLPPQVPAPAMDGGWTQAYADPSADVDQGLEPHDDVCRGGWRTTLRIVASVLQWILWAGGGASQRRLHFPVGRLEELKRQANEDLTHIKELAGKGRGQAKEGGGTATACSAESASGEGANGACGVAALVELAPTDVAAGPAGATTHAAAYGGAEGTAAEAATDAAAAPSVAAAQPVEERQQQQQQQEEEGPEGCAEDEAVHLAEHLGCVPWVSTHDTIVSRLMQVLHGLPLRQGTPMAVSFAANMRQRLAPPLPEGQFGNITYGLALRDLRPSAMRLGHLAALLRRGIIKELGPRFRAALWRIARMYGPRSPPGSLVFKMLSDADPQMSLFSPTGMLLVTNWQVKYERWKFGGCMPFAFVPVGPSSMLPPNTLLLYPAPPSVGGMLGDLGLHNTAWRQLDARGGLAL